jgi:methyl-accepting chemotaxis protein
MKKFKRRNYFIDKSFQSRFVGIIVFVSLPVMAVSAALFSYLSYRQLEAMRWKTHAVSIEGALRPYFIYAVFFAAVFTSVALYFTARHILRRIAGPVHRMRKDIEMLKDGNLSVRIRLRGADEFQETAERLDAMVSSMRDRFETLNENFMEVKRIIEPVKYLDAVSCLSTVRCEQLKRRLEAMGEALSGFNAEKK